MEGLRLGFCDACKTDRRMLAEIRLRTGRVIFLCKACLYEYADRITKTETIYKKH